MNPDLEALRKLADGHVRIVGDPLAVQSKRFGETLRTAKAQVADLESTLRELDDLTGKLAEHGMKIDYTLGPIGDAAAHTRRDIDRENPRTFHLPNGD